MESSYKHIIFDFDGTLADSFQLAIDAANHYAKRYRYRKVTDDNLHILRNSSPRTIIEEFRVKWFFLPFILRQARKYMYKHVDKVKLYSGVIELIKGLDDANKKIYIVSSSMAKLINVVLEKYQLSQYFQAVYGGGKILGKNRKIRQLMKNYHIPHQDCVYIGDELRDIQACRKLDIPIVSVARGYNQKSLLQKHNPDSICESVNELVTMLGAKPHTK